jgi:hypothetical protein
MCHAYVHNYFFFFLLEGRCDSALPAADFEALLVLLSLNTEEALLAAFCDVTFFGAFVCDKALPAAVLDLEPVDLFLSVDEARLAALGRVTFDFAILKSFQGNAVKVLFS